MEMKKAVILNALNQPQEFGIDEYDDHIVMAAYSPDSPVINVDIPAEINGKPVTEIGANCFFDCRNIESIHLPDTITTIRAQAFALCSGIGELIIPDSVTEIENYAFRDCKRLKKVIMSSSLKTLRSGLFAFCYLPDDFDMTLKEGLKTIEEGVFSSGGLALFCTLKLPESIENIAIGAFEPGMKIITSLPYDDGWFEKWPFRQTVRDNNTSGTGTITRITRLEHGCEIHEVSFADRKKEFFYPCDYADKLITFENVESQKRLENHINILKKPENYTGNRISDLYKIRDMWKRGLV